MKKRLFILIAACLIMSGCGNSTSTERPALPTPSETETVSDQSADETPTMNATDDGSDSSAPASDFAQAPSSDNASEDFGDTGSPSTSFESDAPDMSEPESIGDDSSPSSSGVATPSGQSPSGVESNFDNDIDEPVTASENETESDEAGSEKEEAAPAEEAQNEAQNEATEATSEEETPKEESTGYGRIFFVGDSRTVDMFDGNAEEIYDYDASGIRVFAKDGCHCAYLTDVIGRYGTGEFDTLVSWLGCNDNNDAALYESVYESLISQGKTVVICTVGPTADESLSGEFDVANYPNEKMIAFNQSVTGWASAHGVKVIDVYSYVKNNVEISPDGIHYNPKPTTAIWNYIVSNL
ncbi:hypothetical protein SAMN04487770_10857 [Butyrivibrio sp. ob235]|uniref:SGNH/GDSL hydrolase family protein n=1 Tax=Butyrivibrio sp. ob235 TaxID=1761780 RepID=UPI0008BC1718|nr:SGNH/GDSL hydrolase family protein [Butyrivibrio sp. ob235]SEL27762.1 hypothetical protein SAMN04487770_10857 [Butyrivibrio sp. ob235]